MKRKLDDPKLEYIKKLYSRKFLDLNEMEFTNLNPGMQIGADEGKLLGLLIKMQNVKNVLEIGTFLGYSAGWMAKFLPENGIITTIESNKQHYDLASDNFQKLNINHKIKLIYGEALKIMPILHDQKFDMIFIDAKKSEYLEYLNHAEIMLKKNGLLVVDNTLLFDTVFSDNVADDVIVSKNTVLKMKEFNFRLADESKYCSIILPTHHGITISLKIF